MWLERLRSGDGEAVDEIVPRLYDELRRMAHLRLLRERRDHTLKTTALVNEAYLKLQRQRRIRAEDRQQFLAVAGNVMRQVLVDYARGRRRDKRGGGVTPLPLEEAEIVLSESDAEQLLDLDHALTALAEINPEGAEVVQHRFFAGLSLDETAEVLGVSKRTVQRKWLAARAWLRRELRATPLGTSLGSEGPGEISLGGDEE